MFSLVVLCALFHVIHGEIPQQDINNWQLPLFPQGRVVGGSITDISQVPYQLQLEDYGFQFCGASIISPMYALTAAHCTQGRSAYSLQIRYGSSYHAAGGSTIQVAAIHQHPFYNARSTDFDVSVLSLLQGIPFSSNAQPVQLAFTEPSVGEYALVSGWGVLEEGSSSQPFQLQSVMIPVSDRESCNTAYEYRITSNMFCAGQTNHDSCQGDSGGPLVANGVQVGIVSWGYGCARMGYPGVYSNVAQLRNFIDTYTQFQAKWIETNSTV